MTIAAFFLLVLEFTIVLFPSNSSGFICLHLCQVMVVASARVVSAACAGAVVGVVIGISDRMMNVLLEL